MSGHVLCLTLLTVDCSMHIKLTALGLQTKYECGIETPGKQSSNATTQTEKVTCWVLHGFFHL